jgi:hypothetical protein
MHHHTLHTLQMHATPPPHPKPPTTPAAHAVWAYTARVMQLGSFYALRYVDPVWTGVSAVANASTLLVNDVLGLAGGLLAPLAGGTAAPGAPPPPTMGRHLLLLNALSDDGVAAALTAAAATGAGVGSSAHGRALTQSLGDVVNGLGGLLGGAAGAINAARPALDAAVGGVTAGLGGSLASLPLLGELLPNGTASPLFSPLQDVAGAVSGLGGGLLNSTGCPAWCIDLRDQTWISNGCLCDMSRLRVRQQHLMRP